tara:strand:- start:1463 stop:1843 length:381 start_codon:yes stop_codon:yes gene_type:complete
MVIFRNNRRGRFRGGDRNFKRNNGEANKYKSDFPSNTNFQRKAPGRNNHNASKLIEKYNDLAREALTNGDKILSENYFQHADHFTRIIEDQERKKSIKNLENSDTKEIKKDNLEEKQSNQKQIINS